MIVYSPVFVVNNNIIEFDHVLQMYDDTIIT